MIDFGIGNLIGEKIQFNWNGDNFPEEFGISQIYRDEDAFFSEEGKIIGWDRDEDHHVMSLVYSFKDNVVYDRGILNVRFEREPLQKAIRVKRSELLDLENE